MPGGLVRPGAGVPLPAGGAPTGPGALFAPAPTPDGFTPGLAAGPIFGLLVPPVAPAPGEPGLPPERPPLPVPEPCASTGPLAMIPPSSRAATRCFVIRRPPAQLPLQRPRTNSGDRCRFSGSARMRGTRETRPGCGDHQTPRAVERQRWPWKLGQVDTGTSCLTAAKLPRIRREHDAARKANPRSQRGRGRDVRPWRDGHGSSRGYSGVVRERPAIAPRRQFLCGSS